MDLQHGLLMITFGVTITIIGFLIAFFVLGGRARCAGAGGVRKGKEK